MTGIKSVDATIPIGRGQRELIIGDRQTGKTAIALDAILNRQAFDSGDTANQVHCIYVGIGQSNPLLPSLLIFKGPWCNGLYNDCIGNSIRFGCLQYVAPYVGCVMGEYFRDHGKHALIIYDDLSKHAVAYRRCLCCSGVHRGVKRTLVMCFICTLAF